MTLVNEIIIKWKISNDLVLLVDGWLKTGGSTFEGNFYYIESVGISQSILPLNQKE